MKNNQAKLIVGDIKKCKLEVIKAIKAQVNPKKHKLVEKLQYHNMLFFTPKNETYTLDELDSLFEKINFIEDQFFIFIEKADKLNDFSANKLLKTIEEPPAGYYFFLSTENPSLVLPTLRSRCFEQNIEDKTIDKILPTKLENILLNAIENKYEPSNLLSLEKEIKPEEIISAAWYIVEKKPKCYQKLRKILEHGVMPGSSKIALKYLYSLFLEIGDE